MNISQIERTKIARRSRTSRRKRKPPTVLTAEELRKLFTNSTDHVCGIMLRLIYGAGLRLNEIVRLRVEDLDFECMTISVQKGGGDTRLTIMPRSLRVPLMREISCKTPDAFVFSLKRNGSAPISPRTLQHYLSQKIRELSTPRITLQSLRETFAVHMLEQGLDARLVRQLMGYAHERSLARYLDYVEELPARLVSPMDFTGFGEVVSRAG